MPNSTLGKAGLGKQRWAARVLACALALAPASAWAQNGANWNDKFAQIEGDQLCQYAVISIPMQNCSGANGAECDYVLSLYNQNATPLPIHLWMSQPPSGWTVYQDALVKPLGLTAHGSTQLKLFRSGKTAPSRPVFVSVTCPTSTGVTR